jgi:hypothetical protein
MAISTGRARGCNGIDPDDLARKGPVGNAVDADIDVLARAQLHSGRDRSGGLKLHGGEIGKADQRCTCGDHSAGLDRAGRHHPVKRCRDRRIAQRQLGKPDEIVQRGQLRPQPVDRALRLFKRRGRCNVAVDQLAHAFKLTLGQRQLGPRRRTVRPRLSKFDRQTLDIDLDKDIALHDTITGAKVHRLDQPAGLGRKVGAAGGVDRPYHLDPAVKIARHEGAVVGGVDLHPWHGRGFGIGKGRGLGRLQCCGDRSALEPRGNRRAKNEDKQHPRPAPPRRKPARCAFAHPPLAPGQRPVGLLLRSRL